MQCHSAFRVKDATVYLLHCYRYYRWIEPSKYGQNFCKQRYENKQNCYLRNTILFIFPSISWKQRHVLKKRCERLRILTNWKWHFLVMQNVTFYFMDLCVFWCDSYRELWDANTRLRGRYGWSSSSHIQASTHQGVSHLL